MLSSPNIREKWDQCLFNKKGVIIYLNLLLKNELNSERNNTAVAFDQMDLTL